MEAKTILPIAKWGLSVSVLTGLASFVMFTKVEKREKKYLMYIPYFIGVSCILAACQLFNPVFAGLGILFILLAMVLFVRELR